MKKLLTLIVSILFAFASFAENTVTTFLGIPVDGSRSEMIRKLKEKGFEYYNYYSEIENNFLVGNFNGEKVTLYIVTNQLAGQNDKVRRIVVRFPPTSSAVEARIQFNNLVSQFVNNPNYSCLTDSIPYIPADERISLYIADKNYEAIFIQGNTDINRQVWFRISKSNDYYYRLRLYYDNLYNVSHGEDL